MTGSEHIILGDGPWEEIEPGILVNRTTGERIDVAARKMYDAQGNMIGDLSEGEDEPEDEVAE